MNCVDKHHMVLEGNLRELVKDICNICLYVCICAYVLCNIYVVIDVMKLISN